MTVGDFIPISGYNLQGGAHGFQHIGIAYNGKGQAELVEGHQQGQVFPIVLKHLFAEVRAGLAGKVWAGNHCPAFIVIEEEVEIKA